MRTRSKLFSSLVLLSACLTAAPARAVTWAYEPSLVQIIGAASLAFEGTVEDIHYGASPPSKAGSLPYTAVTFKVSRAWAGAEPGESVQILNVGGRLPGSDRLYYSIPGLPFYRLGERVLVFANDSVQPFAGALFGDNGVLRVVDDGQGRSLVLTHGWRPLERGSEGSLGGVAPLRCRADPKRLDRCEAWISADGDRAQTTVLDPRNACAEELLTLDDLAGAIPRVRADVRPPQETQRAGLSRNEAEFGEALHKVLERNRTLFDHVTSVLAADGGEQKPGEDEKEKGS